MQIKLNVVVVVVVAIFVKVKGEVMRWQRKLKFRKLSLTRAQ